MSHIFHDWIFAGEVDITEPKRGPYDPRTDKQRTRAMWKDVCSQCGKERIREIPYPDYF